MKVERDPRAKKSFPVVFHPTLRYFVGIAVPEDSFYTLAAQITEASGASCKGTTCYGTTGSDFPDLVSQALNDTGRYCRDASRLVHYKKPSLTDLHKLGLTDVSQNSSD